MIAFGLLLFAAFLNSAYSVFQKHSDDRLSFFAIVNLFSCFLGLALIGLVPAPQGVTWLFLCGSCFFYSLMLIFLNKAFSGADLSAVFPFIASIKIISAVAASYLFYDDAVYLNELFAISLLLLALLVMQLSKEVQMHIHHRVFFLGFLAGIFSASQFVIDIGGVRSSGTPFSYVVWEMFIGLPVMVAAFLKYRKKMFVRFNSQYKAAAISCFCDNVSHAILLYAIYVANVAYALPVYNMNIVLSSILAYFFLKERLTKSRVLIATLVTCAAILAA